MAEAARVEVPERVVTRGGEFTVSLSEYYMDLLRQKEDPGQARAAVERIKDCQSLCSILSALGFEAPREMYHPAPHQKPHVFDKSLRIVAPSQPGMKQDCSVRLCAPRSCWYYIYELEAEPLNLTAAESLVVRPSLLCGPSAEVIDFCQILSQSGDDPGQFAMPQQVMVPPTGCFKLDFFSLDGYSEARVGIRGRAWLVPDIPRGLPRRAT